VAAPAVAGGGNPFEPAVFIKPVALLALNLVQFGMRFMGKGEFFFRMEVFHVIASVPGYDECEHSENHEWYDERKKCFYRQLAEIKFHGCLPVRRYHGINPDTDRKMCSTGCVNKNMVLIGGMKM